MSIYEIDDGHHGVRRQAMSYPHAVRIALALSCGGTAVIWKDSDPRFMVVYRYGRRVK
jgi:hypothetical protein